MPLMICSPNIPAVESCRLKVAGWKFRARRFSKPATRNFQLATNSFSSVHLAEHNVHAAENDHGVGNPVAEAHVFEHRQIDEARRAHAVAIRIRRAVADQIKSELAFRAFDAAINFARLRTEAAQF